MHCHFSELESVDTECTQLLLVSNSTNGIEVIQITANVTFLAFSGISFLHF